MKNIHRAKHSKTCLVLLAHCLWLSTFLFPHFGNSQPQNIRFLDLNNASKLSQNWVQTICQDQYGFIWIGTEDGLNRYDGYDFTIYKYNNDDSTSLSSNGVYSLFEDSKGRLWIGTSRGLNLYDRQYDRFIRNPRWPHSVLAITEDEKNNLWAGGYDGLYHINFATDSITLYNTSAQMPPYQGRINSNTLARVLIDSKKNIWVGSLNGLNVLDTKKYRIINYQHIDNDPQSLANDNVRSLAEDSSGRIWIGTGNGVSLFTYDGEIPVKGKFANFKNNPQDEKSISAGLVLSLMVVHTNKLWIGVENGGLNILDLSLFDKGIVHFDHLLSSTVGTGNVSNNSIYSLYQDRQKNIWIGTYSAGVKINSATGNYFVTVANEKNNKSSLSNNNVNTFFEEKDCLWIGTEGGLNRYDKRTGEYKHFTHDPADPKSIGSNAVWAIYKDRRGNLWVGTWAGGLNLFNYKTETFTHYYNNPKDSNSLASDNIFSLAGDREGKILIGTMGGGLSILDPITKKFISYNLTNSNIYTNYVQAIAETKKGDIWMSNITALVRFDKGTKQFERYINDEQDSTSLSGKGVICLFEDSKEHLWIGTDDGLSVFNKTTKKFLRYPAKRGLPSNYIVSITEDNNGNLWIGTNNGLSQFIDAVNLPENPLFRNFTVEDGLQGNDFTRRSCWKAIDGNFYFGGSKGFNVFNPKNIVNNPYISPVFITGFQIFNKPVPIAVEGSPLQTNISITKELVLSYKHSVFSFDFVALNYISSSKNKYAYIMEGFDENWNYDGTKRSVTYTNLDPGEYTFRVKGSNNDGVWNEQGTSIHIIIAPPFWQTLWFKLIIAAVLLGSVFAMYKRWMRTRELEEKRRIDEALARERNLLRTVIDNLPDGIFVKDLKSRKTLANRADVHNTGSKSEAEVLGKDDYELFPKEMAEGFIADDRLVMQTGQPVINREEYVVDAQGQKHFLLTTKLPFRDEQGEIIGLIGIGRDITERKQIEAALLEREELYRSLISASPDAISVVDLQGSIMYISSKASEIFGESKMDAMIGRHIFEWIAPEFHEKAKASMQQILNQGSSRDQEFTLVRTDGSRFIGEINSSLFCNANGEPSGIILVTRDITKRKLAEEALSQKTALLEAQLNSSIDGILVVDNQGKKILQNQRTVELWKIPKEIADNPNDQMQVDHVMHSTKDPDQFVSQVKYLYDHLNESSRDEIELKDGTILDRYSAPVIGNDGRNYGRIWSFRDITARKRVEEEREILIAELQNALADVKVLKGLVPICSNCKKIRDDSGFWNQLESYIQKHSQAKFSHGICPECMAQLYPDIQIKME